MPRTFWILNGAVKARGRNLVFLSFQYIFLKKWKKEENIFGPVRLRVFSWRASIRQNARDTSPLVQSFSIISLFCCRAKRKKDLGDWEVLSLRKIMAVYYDAVFDINIVIEYTDREYAKKIFDNVLYLYANKKIKCLLSHKNGWNVCVAKISLQKSFYFQRKVSFCMNSLARIATFILYLRIWVSFGNWR